ncbi:MAG: phosphonate metabolism protein/1,5-bisphosphokinase (PRPP-forming) PhnN, partial [Tateyamaria sp.]
LSRCVLSQARRRFTGLQIIAFTADPDVLADRLAARGRESSAAIARRLSRAGTGVPDGLDATTIDNSGDLTTTVTAALNSLYPVRA